MSAITERGRRAVLDLVRPDLRGFTPYRSASPRRGFVRLHANEAPWEPPGVEPPDLNRYPEPDSAALAGGLAALYGVSSDRVLPVRGSDDGVDVIVRAFCRAERDAVLITPPTFGMYEVSARVQGARVVSVLLDPEQGFALDPEAVLAAAEDTLRVVFLCTPNSPTGNAIPRDDLLRVVRGVAGRAVVVIDEAYAEFADSPGAVDLLEEFDHILILRTLSKAHALAGLRCGAVLGDPDLLRFLRGLLPPYPIPRPVVGTVLGALSPTAREASKARIAVLRQERERLRADLNALGCVTRTWPSEGNFLLVSFRDLSAARSACEAAGVLIRDVSGQPGLAGCARITVGTDADSDRVLAALEGVR